MSHIRQHELPSPSVYPSEGKLESKKVCGPSYPSQQWLDTLLFKSCPSTS